MQIDITAPSQIVHLKKYLFNFNFISLPWFYHSLTYKEKFEKTAMILQLLQLLDNGQQCCHIYVSFSPICL